MSASDAELVSRKEFATKLATSPAIIGVVGLLCNIVPIITQMIEIKPVSKNITDDSGYH